MPDCVDFNNLIIPTMTVLSPHFLPTQPDQASVSLSDHDDSHFTLDLQGLNSTLGTPFLGLVLLALFILSAVGIVVSFHAIFLAFYTEYERDDRALSLSSSQNALWVKSVDGKHTSYHSTSNTVSVSHPYCHCPTLIQSHYPSLHSSPFKPPSRPKLLAGAFRPSSTFPNEACARLLDLIIEAHFIKTHQLEPSIDSREGQALLRNVWNLPGCPPMAFQKSNLSIFALSVDLYGCRCLICGSAKTSLDRAIACVHSHFDHRPFVCGGGPVGCVRYKDYARSDSFEGHTVNMYLHSTIQATAFLLFVICGGPH
jgi:hypothetical protein